MAKRMTPKQIRRRRLEHGLSQQALANEVGLKAGSYISFIENGMKPKDPAVLDRIEERLNMDVPPEVVKAVREKAERRKVRLAAEKRRAERAEAVAV